MQEWLVTRLNAPTTVVVTLDLISQATASGIFPRLDFARSKSKGIWAIKVNRGGIYSVGGIESIVEPPNTLTSGYRRWSVFLFAAAAQSSREEDIFFLWYRENPPYGIDCRTEKLHRVHAYNFSFLLLFIIILHVRLLPSLERERNFDCVMRHVPCIRPTQDLIVFSPYALAEKFETTKEDGWKKRREFRGVEKKGTHKRSGASKDEWRAHWLKPGLHAPREPAKAIRLKE